MFKSALTKTIFISFLFFLALFISLPQNINLKINKGFINIDKSLSKPPLSIRNVKLFGNPQLIQGLDLAGGSHLVFEIDTSKLDSSRKNDAIDSVKEVMERRVNLFGISEPNVQVSSFEGKDRVIVELPGIKDTKQAIDVMGKTAQLGFAQTGSEEEPGIFPTDLNGSELEKAEVVFDQTTGNPVVSIKFNDSGSEKFSKLTQENLNKPLPILLDGNVISAPIVQEQISGGSAQISGDFTLDEAKNLAIQINAGALPAPVKLVEERSVGATLGAESVQKSIRAGLVGLTMVLIFMALMYGRMGVIADIALIVFGVITLTLYKMIPVVLTLPGIAGFLLSVGMAVDSNILIFERFKEEIKKRKFSDALEVSFGRAWESIRDANVATLVTAFILANPFDWNFLHTSGPVRGFAITLSLGIVISLFTGIVVTRNLLRAFLKEK